jgi:predicted metal-dependent HD superfamily phosphohydrolase
MAIPMRDPWLLPVLQKWKKLMEERKDITILGATWEDYQVYIMAVRKEYNIYPDMLYRPGRKKFLEQTLAAREIFHTQEFKLRFDAAARNNMEKELQYLCGK